ncbi:MAG: FAD:protein FMN transferase [Betaproteobacteria bacterium]|nr:FAD:protein FMN transferase [Betaproteobacteria bacterium]
MRPAPAPGGPSGLFRRAHLALGTLVELQLHADDQIQASRAMRSACAVLDRIQAAMSAHSPHSDLARIARATPGSLLRVDCHTTAVLRRARHWHRASGGRFDPRVGAALAARGLRPGLARGEAAWAHDLDAVCIEDDTHLRVHQPLALDFGGIAKGHAVDCAVLALQEAGIASGLVNAGGDMRAFGPCSWPLTLRLPASALASCRPSALPGWLRRGLHDAALATSRPNQDLSWSHGRPGRAGQAQSPRLVCVLARRCIDADALTKALLVSRRLPPGLLQQAGARGWRMDVEAR